MIAYAVAVRREDGTEFLASAGGILPRVHHQRKYAVQFKRELLEHFPKRCRVVRMEYTEPRILED